MNKFGQTGRCSIWGSMGVLLAFVVFVQVQNRRINASDENSSISFQIIAVAKAADDDLRPDVYAFDLSTLVPHYLPGHVCVPLTPLDNVSPQREEGDTANASAPSAAELFIDAVVMIESHGDPRTVGAAGERGLMQIMPGTWEEATRKIFGKPLPFDRAFEPDLNRQVGTFYLGEIQRRLSDYQEDWDSDLRSLILASYNAGFGSVARSGFSVDDLSSPVQSYVRRCSNIHNVLLDQERGRDQWASIDTEHER